MSVGQAWTAGITLEAAEKEIILRAFEFFKHNKQLTAQSLGIAIRTLDSKLEKYEVDMKVVKEAQRARRREQEDFDLRQRGQHPDQIERLQRLIREEKEAARHALDSEGGVRLESDGKLSSKLDMPVSERAKVQGVSSGKTPSARPDRSRQ